jgi:Na+/H+ antiporter NhaD/arsenite permease-like protein
LRVIVVGLILLVAISTNFVVNLKFPAQADHFPFIGVAAWVGIFAAVPVRSSNWSLLPRSFGGSIFLLALVAAASLMPVEHLPTPSWQTTLWLGFLSAIFDNIPLTALALKQGGYDWAFLAYAVGFGGSMVWFGSSAGVALCNMYREGRSVVQWVRYGWWIVIAYVVSFFAMFSVSRWHPDPTPSQLTTQTSVTLSESNGNVLSFPIRRHDCHKIELSW